MIINGAVPIQGGLPFSLPATEPGQYGFRSAAKLYQYQTEHPRQCQPFSVSVADPDQVDLSTLGQAVESGQLPTAYARDLIGYARGTIQALAQQRGEERDYLLPKDLHRQFGVTCTGAEFVARNHAQGQADLDDEGLLAVYDDLVGTADAVFGALDVNADGRLSPQEYSNLVLFQEGVGYWAHTFDEAIYSPERLLDIACQYEATKPLPPRWEQLESGAHTAMDLDGVVSFREQGLANAVLSFTYMLETVDEPDEDEDEGEDGPTFDTGSGWTDADDDMTDGISHPEARPEVQDEAQDEVQGAANIAELFEPVLALGLAQCNLKGEPQDAD